MDDSERSSYANPLCLTSLATNSNYWKAYKTLKNSSYCLQTKAFDPALLNAPSTSKPPWTIYPTWPPTNNSDPMTCYSQSLASKKTSLNSWETTTTLSQKMTIHSFCVLSQSKTNTITFISQPRCIKHPGSRAPSQGKLATLCIYWDIGVIKN
jgi:hypothetical protein